MSPGENLFPPTWKHFREDKTFPCLPAHTLSVDSILFSGSIYHCSRCLSFQLVSMLLLRWSRFDVMITLTSWLAYRRQIHPFSYLNRYPLPRNGTLLLSLFRSKENVVRGRHSYAIRENRSSKSCISERSWKNSNPKWFSETPADYFIVELLKSSSEKRGARSFQRAESEKERKKKCELHSGSRDSTRALEDKSFIEFTKMPNRELS